LLLTLALQSAVPPFATDMYTPAFPQVTADLATSASLVGLTLTTFFLGMALGQLLGGPLSDQRGRRMPMIVGGLICTLGAVGSALAPSIGFLVASRIVQGFGGGLAAVVALRRRHHRCSDDLGHDRRYRRLPVQLPCARANPIQHGVSRSH